MDEGQTGQLVFFVFDLLFLDGESTARLPLSQRKQRLHRLFAKMLGRVRYSERVLTDGPRFREQACKLGLEGVTGGLASWVWLIWPDDRHATGRRGASQSRCTSQKSRPGVNLASQDTTWPQQRLETGKRRLLMDDQTKGPPGS
jgi:ATP dependent DNA ligase domain